MAKEIPHSVKLYLQSVLLSRQGGVKQTSIEKDYYTLTNGTRLDVIIKEYGYKNLYEFLLALPDVARLEYSEKDGENKVFGVGLKGVFMSDHAKKAQGVPNGRTHLPPSEWPRNKLNTCKERKVPPKTEDGGKQITRDKRGMYALHVSNLPLNCVQAEVYKVFKRFQSIRQVKVEGSSSKRVAFVRFSQYGDAVKALHEMNGFILQGFKLIVKPGIENRAKVNKNTDPLSLELKKENDSAKSCDAVDSRRTNLSHDPGKTMQANTNKSDMHLSIENWETEIHPSLPKNHADSDMFPLYEERFVEEEGGVYPIHVSNFPVGTTEETLQNLFSTCGDISHITCREKFAFIFYVTREGATTALRMMKQIRIGDSVLTVTPKITNYRRLEEQNAISLSGQLSRLSVSSSHSSISSCDSSAPKPDAGYCSGDSGNDQTSKQITETNSTGKVNLLCEPPASVSLKPSTRLHTLLSLEETRELMKRTGTVFKTNNNIAPQDQQFDILVTEVVDACHFWAIVDDKSGSYGKLLELGQNLQKVEHHKNCMPLKFDLGAALYSEDGLWYRCWCLEVSRVEKHEVKVFYVDYGNCEWTSWDNYTDIHKKCWDLAPQAVPFKLAGLEPASNVAPEVSKEGTKYLKALICDKVCKATKKSNSEDYIIEVDLVLKDASNNGYSNLVNKQMNLTRYVKETKRETQIGGGHQQPLPAQQMTLGTIQQPFMSGQPQLAKPKLKHSLNSQQLVTDQGSGTMPTEQTLHPQPKLSRPLLSEQSKPAQKPLPLQQNNQIAVTRPPKQKLVKPVQTKQASKPEEKQQFQQSLPSQLFEKKEVWNVKLSHVASPNELYFNLDDDNTQRTLKRINHTLETSVNRSAKIYPRVGDVVVKIARNGKLVRSRIQSIPRTGFGVDKVSMFNVDFGQTENVPLSALCELPTSLRDEPFQAVRCKLAGIQRSRNFPFWPELAFSSLVIAKRNFESLKASIVEKQTDGVLLVELFDSSGKSFNVQVIESGYGVLDERQCHLKPTIVTPVTTVGAQSSDGRSVETTNHVPATLQNSRWHQAAAVSMSDGLQSCKQSVASDWEESLQEEDWDLDLVHTATPVGNGHCTGTETHTGKHLYVPPPPEVHALFGVGREESESHLDASEASVPYKSIELGVSDAGSDKGTGKEKDLDETASQQSIELEEGEKELLNGTMQGFVGWKVEKEQLIRKDEELQVMLSKPHEEIKRILQLNQEKEKLERKIRIKEMENQILRLQKELNQLESSKLKLEEELK